MNQENDNSEAIAAGITGFGVGSLLKYGSKSALAVELGLNTADLVERGANALVANGGYWAHRAGIGLKDFFGGYENEEEHLKAIENAKRRKENFEKKNTETVTEKILKNYVGHGAENLLLVPAAKNIMNATGSEELKPIPSQVNSDKSADNMKLLSESQRKAEEKNEQEKDGSVVLKNISSSIRDISQKASVIIDYIKEANSISGFRGMDYQMINADN